MTLDESILEFLSFDFWTPTMAIVEHVGYSNDTVLRHLHKLQSKHKVISQELVKGLRKNPRYCWKKVNLDFDHEDLQLPFLEA